MLRYIALLLSTLALIGTAQACDMSLEYRPAQLADYVENGHACLKAPPPGFAFDSAFEAAFTLKINQERIARGLAPLIPRLDMRPAARFHSLDMGANRFFTHESRAGRTQANRIAAFDRTLLATFTAENLAKEERICEDRTGRVVTCRKPPAKTPTETLNRLHQNLMNSPSHRKNILSPLATHIALGVVRRGGDVYVTQLFAKPSGALPEPLPLRLAAGSQITLEPKLADWTFSKFAFLTGQIRTDLNRGLIPPSARGDTQLRARGERRGEPTITREKIVQPIEYIYLAGPSLTIVPSTGN